MNRVISDPKMREEFFDRFNELRNESIDRVNKSRAVNYNNFDDIYAIPYVLSYPKEDLVKIAEEVGENENRPAHIVMKQLMERFARPAYFVKDDSFDTRNTPSTSELIDNTANNQLT